MAGNYPDAPSYRMAHDKDGTTWFHERGGVLTQLTAAQVTSLNNEADDVAYTSPGAGAGTMTICAIFPELRDIDAYFTSVTRNSNFVTAQAFEVSTDTTNVLDGTWVSLGTTTDLMNTAPKPAYRNQIRSLTAKAQRAIRFRYYDNNSFGISWKNIHLYGQPIAGANPNRLEVWHPTLDQRPAPNYFDFAESPRNSQAVVQFRTKNLSGTQTASGVIVSVETLTDATPSLVGQFQVSLDGLTYSTSVNVGNLAPGAMSPLIYVRRNLSTTAALGLWSLRLKAAATSWA